MKEVLVDELVNNAGNQLIEEYCELALPCHYDRTLPLYYAFYDPVGTFFSGHQLLFIKGSFGLGRAIAAAGYIPDVRSCEAGGNPHDMYTGMQ